MTDDELDKEIQDILERLREIYEKTEKETDAITKRYRTYARYCMTGFGICVATLSLWFITAVFASVERLNDPVQLQEMCYALDRMGESHD